MYEARLEDYLQGTPDAELAEHLRQCANCSAALDNSRLAGDLVRQVWEPAAEPRPVFLRGVLAKIREEKIRSESPAAFWSPLEFLASRLSLTAAVLLLILSAYLVGFAPRRPQAEPLRSRTELSASDFPQPPGDPDSNEEVLISLAERHYGR
jgi:predicted anti-sigma-YlaC factor YlaD